MTLPETFQEATDASTAEPPRIPRWIDDQPAVRLVDRVRGDLLMLGALLALLVLLFAGTAFGAEPESGPPRVWLEFVGYPVDADTVRGTIEFPLGLALRDQTVRGYGWDAYETSRRRQTVEVTDDEIRRGKRATDDLSDLMDSGRMFISVHSARDPYGRVLADWMLVKRDGQRVYVGEWLEANGHLREPRAVTEEKYR